MRKSAIIASLTAAVLVFMPVSAEAKAKGHKHHGKPVAVRMIHVKDLPPPPKIPPRRDPGPVVCPRPVPGVPVPCFPVPPTRPF
jgi:hypothetical protein